MRTNIEQQLDDAVLNSDAARRLMETPALIDAFTRLEQSYVDGWRTSPPHKPDERETFYFKLTILRELRADLENQIAGSRVVELNHRSKIKR